MFAQNQNFQRLIGGGFLEQTGIKLLGEFEMSMLAVHKDRDVTRSIRRIRRKRPTLLTGFESFIVYSLARAHAAKEGALAEVGVYQGGSARLLCEVKGDKPLHLFDTFSGLPPGTAPDGQVHRPQQYTARLDSVRAFLRDEKNVHFHPGLFPATAAVVQDETFCFAHFDVDLYESTRACLEFFYPRMVRGGAMLSHDYSLLAGVRQAFQEFFADKPEVIFELPTTQCVVTKV